MIMATLEIAVVAAVAIYLAATKINFSRRKRLAWDRLMAQLRPISLGPELNHKPSRCLSDRRASEDKWQALHSVSDLWSMYANARVMLDLANYVAEANATIDQELLANLRNDAMHIRLHVILALTQSACNQVNESARENVDRATVLYRDMVQTMTELIQANGEVFAPHVA